MDLTRIKQANYLENTVLLYRGVIKMYELWSREHTEDERTDPQLLWGNFAEFTSNLEKDAVAEKDTRNLATKWRYQNTLKDFFRFLEDEQKMTRGNLVAGVVSEDAAKLLCLYDCAKAIEEYVVDQEKNAYIPYLYERLCNSMRDIAQSNMCYLADLRNGNFTPLATSSFAEELLDYVLDESDFLQIHKLWRQRSRENDKERDTEGKPVAGTIFRTMIWKKSARENRYQRFHILALRLNVSRSEKERYYIVFQTTDSSTKEQDTWMERSDSDPINVTNTDLKRMRDILFLRASLVRLTGQSLHILVLSQATYRYVLPLGKNNRLTILHLTDLHIKTKNKAEFEEIFRHFPEKTPDGDPVDLVAITGDVVQGQGSAGELEEHYFLADKLLRELAKRLWHYEGTSYLRGDWKKRLVIIPGNHDYAAMNELEVISQKGARSTGTGRPAQKEGGPMVKFAYYIHFISRLLGIDMGEQIRDWLNSVRHYDQMGLALLCLNTSAGAGPLRNNKVHIDPDFIEKLDKTGNFEKKLTICLAHHTFAYKPDYAVDRYYTAANQNKINEYVQQFRKILEYDSEKEQESIKNELNKLYDELMAAKVDLEDALMADVAYYREYFRSRDNERCEAIRSAMHRDDAMQDADLKSQRKIYERLNSAAGIKITLGGHIHKAKSAEDQNCYEGPMFYRSGKDYVEYAVLSMDMAQSEYDWIHYQQKTDGTEIKAQMDESLRGIKIGKIVSSAT